MGTEPQGVAVNPTTNRIYVANSGSYTVSVIGWTVAQGVQQVCLENNQEDEQGGLIEQKLMASRDKPRLAMVNQARTLMPDSQ